MTAPNRPLLLVSTLASLDGLPPEVRAVLDARFEIAETDRAAGGRMDEGSVLEIVGGLGEGVGLVDPRGEVLWMNARLAAVSPAMLRAFADACVQGLEQLAEFDTEETTELEAGGPHSVRESLSLEESEFEVVVAPFTAEGGERRAIGLLLDVTANRRLQNRIEQVDVAGGELLDLDTEWVSRPVTVRLRQIEDRLARGIESILGEAAFEVRLVEPRTGQLELVMSRGIEPLPIGQRMFARPEGHGISGLVASSGEGYVCGDAASDIRFMSGLPEAASSVTVPLRRGERVIGTLNVESTVPSRFGEEDRFCLELYGRYLGLALTILDMLVVERYTTNRQVVENISSEIRGSLAALADLAGRLDLGGDAASAGSLREATAAIEARLDTSAGGPQSILGAEAFLRDAEIESTLSGHRVLVADDEPQIRQTIRAVLERCGCEVTVCEDGAAAIEAIEATGSAAAEPFELVISDVRMPDRNGYEVFRAAKDAAADTPVILMTGFGYDPHHSIVRSSQEGLHCFLFKPFQVGQLLDEVRKALRERAT
ncbi:MAG: response regulator [Planctomycetota bacterium]|jgi:CheY-like chemotaxis protein